METVKSNLKKLTENLLRSDADYGQMKQAADSLYELYKNAVLLEEDSSQARQAVFTPTGKAIDTFEAGMCVKEFLRTRKFIAGLVDSVKEAKRRFPNKCIHILYAGTGPFAALMLPLTTMFTEEEVKFTLLEINKTSITYLNRLISHFEVEQYVQDIIETDAASCDLDFKEPVHILVTETMQRALKKEPQVSIVLNLIDTLENEGLLIPEEIRVSAALFDDKRDKMRMFGDTQAAKDYYEVLADVLKFNKTSALKHSKAYKADRQQFRFSENALTIGDTIDKRFNRLVLLTEIKVFNDYVLKNYECSLNLPYPLFNLNTQENSETRLTRSLALQYVVSEEPGFKITK